MIRKMIEIDESRCDGCGQCALACAEGAIEIRNGKAKVVSDVFCDGLGACIGECPWGALRIVERDAPAFDEDAVKRNLAPSGCPSTKPMSLKMASPTVPAGNPCGCQSAEPRELGATIGGATGESQPSTLRQWPVQLRLVPSGGPFYAGKPLTILADCAAVSHPNLHRDILAGQVIALACPKFEDGGWLSGKLMGIFRDGKPSEVRVVRMEVPCCGALTNAVRGAAVEAGSDVAVNELVVSIDGTGEEA